MLSEEVRKEICGYFSSSLNSRQVAEKMNVDPTTVRYWWLKEFGKEACAAKTHRIRSNHGKRIGKANRKLIRLCQIDGCQEIRTYKTGLCGKHQQRLKRHGNPELGAIPDNRITSGSVTVDGYRVIRVRRNGVSRVLLEHRFILEEEVGRPLTKDEHVHHVNGCRSDNRRENLELWSTSHPSGQRVEDLVTWAREFILKYENPIRKRPRSRGKSDTDSCRNP